MGLLVSCRVVGIFDSFSQSITAFVPKKELLFVFGEEIGHVLDGQVLQYWLIVLDEIVLAPVASAFLPGVNFPFSVSATMSGPKSENPLLVILNRNLIFVYFNRLT